VSASSSFKQLAVLAPRSVSSQWTNANTSCADSFPDVGSNIRRDSISVPGNVMPGLSDSLSTLCESEVDPTMTSIKGALNPMVPVPPEDDEHDDDASEYPATSADASDDDDGDDGDGDDGKAGTGMGSREGTVVDTMLVC